MNRSDDSLPILNSTLTEGISQRKLSILLILYESYGPLLYGSILPVLKDPVRATQILVETFLHAINHIHTHDSRLGLYTWFQQIAWYKTLGEITVTVTGKPLPDGLEIEDYAVAFAGLSEFEQHIIRLLVFKGLGHPEISARMQLPLHDLRQEIIATLTHFHSLLS